MNLIGLCVISSKSHLMMLSCNTLRFLLASHWVGLKKKKKKLDGKGDGQALITQAQGSWDWF